MNFFRKIFGSNEDNQPLVINSDNSVTIPDSIKDNPKNIKKFLETHGYSYLDNFTLMRKLLTIVRDENVYPDKIEDALVVWNSGTIQAYKLLGFPADFLNVFLDEIETEALHFSKPTNVEIYIKFSDEQEDTAEQ